MNYAFTWIASSGRIEIGFETPDDAESCAHPGPCDFDVEALANEQYMAEQLADLDPTQLRQELMEYGAWDDLELQDHEANLLRILWIAANDVAESPEDYRVEYEGEHPAPEDRLDAKADDNYSAKRNGDWD